MHEGGVADHCYRLALGGTAAGLVEAVEAGDRGTHADGGVDGSQRRYRAQGVAADIAQDRKLVLGQGIEETTVGAAGAHDRGTGRNALLESGTLLIGNPQLLRHSVLIELDVYKRQHWPSWSGMAALSTSGSMCVSILGTVRTCFWRAMSGLPRRLSLIHI